jgi:hypothetical protein
MTLYEHRLQEGQSFWSSAPPSRAFRGQGSILSPTGWFATLALGVVVAGAALALAT